MNFNFSINEATSRETVRHEDQKSVSKISRENTQNNIKENERKKKRAHATTYDNKYTQGHT